MGGQLQEMIAPVEGWLGDQEAAALHHAAATAPSADPVAVEIGSWKGKSTVAIASAFRDRGAGTVYAVDPHQGTLPHELEDADDTFGEFLANIDRAGVDEHVEPVRAISADARPAVTRPADLVFIDGSHEYEDVIVDIDLWTRDLVPGATVAFHDSVFYEGVTRALRERVLRRGPFRSPRLVENLMVVRYDPGPWTAGDAVAMVGMRVRLRWLLVRAWLGRTVLRRHRD